MMNPFTQQVALPLTQAIHLLFGWGLERMLEVAMSESVMGFIAARMVVHLGKIWV